MEKEELNETDIMTFIGMIEFQWYWVRLFFKYPSYSKELKDIWLRVMKWIMDSFLFELEEFVAWVWVNITNNVYQYEKLHEHFDNVTNGIMRNGILTTHLNSH